MSEHRRGIVTGGTWCVDYNRVVSHWPEEDGMAEILGEERHGGGSACNLAIDIKRLDPAMPVDTIGVVGSDEAGRYLVSLAEEFGIGTDQLTVTDAMGTQFCDAYVSRITHRRTHVYSVGAAGLLTPEQFDFSATRARYLHLGLPGVHRQLDAPHGGDASGWVTVLKMARAAGLKTNLELASIEKDLLLKLTLPCLPHLDFIIVNDHEIGALAGMATVQHGVTDIAACEQAALRVLENGAMSVVVVHCPAVAIAVSRDGPRLIKPSVAIPPELVVGANGAGDAFAAGMLYGLHETWPLEECVLLAHATAATSLRSIATTVTVEPWRKCLDLAQSWGWRSAPEPAGHRREA